jgi:hypothetical protein
MGRSPNFLNVAEADSQQNYSLWQVIPFVAVDSDKPQPQGSRTAEPTTHGTTGVEAGNTRERVSPVEEGVRQANPGGLWSFDQGRPWQGLGYPGGLCAGARA